ncbi:Mesoderm posterior protein 2 [Myotis davidii]|uniref:Mesoderm posterior protein 2 n=1 Tax=Myotis davidii TaxID=225400 RepID=L5M011_MYODS|nr:Mesoderm posterior protein 2 [Myotis davidii]
MPGLFRSCLPHSEEHPGSRSQGIRQEPTNQLLLSLLQGICVSPESYLLPETPPLLPGPACQRLQPQTQWGYWNHSAEGLPSSEHQGPGPTFHFSDENPLQSSGLQLSGCPELWQEDLEGGHLSIFY